MAHKDDDLAGVFQQCICGMNFVKRMQNEIDLAGLFSEMIRFEPMQVIDRTPQCRVNNIAGALYRGVRVVSAAA